MSQTTSNQLLSEQLEPLRKLVAKYPGSKNAKSIHVATAHRWCLRGIRRKGQVIRLEHVRTGNQVLSSQPALERFFAALTGDDLVPPPNPKPTPCAKKRAAERADKALADVLS